MVNNEEQNGIENGKREGATYPYLPLATALGVGDAVKDLGGARSKVLKSVLASHLKESEKSPAFAQRLISAKSFGLIEGRGAFALTDLAQRFFFPTTETEKSSALLEIAGFPEAFRVIITRFDGAKLPEREIVANILHRECRVPESWKDRVASYFEKAAKLAGALDENGFLRFGAAKEARPAGMRASREIPPTPDSSAVASLSRATIKDSPLSATSDVNVWTFSHQGNTVHVETPKSLSKPLWEKLEGYVKLIKPIEETPA